MNRANAEFRQLLVGALPRLRRFSAALTGSADEGDDLAQAAVERALLNADKWKAEGRFESWMFKIAQNIWFDRRREAGRHGVNVPLDGELATVEDGRDTAENSIMAAHARRAIAGLPEEQRSVVALVLVEGMSYREAADILQVPTGTIMSRLSRARQALAKTLRVGEGASTGADHRGAKI